MRNITVKLVWALLPTFKRVTVSHTITTTKHSVMPNLCYWVLIVSLYCILSQI